MPLIDRDGNEVEWNLIERFKSNLLPLTESVTGETARTYFKPRESWIQLRADMKRFEGTNITCYSFRHYYALRCHLKLIDFGSVFLIMGHSIEPHHKNYPYSKESKTTNAF